MLQILKINMLGIKSIGNNAFFIMNIAPHIYTIIINNLVYENTTKTSFHCILNVFLNITAYDKLTEKKYGRCFSSMR